MPDFFVLAFYAVLGLGMAAVIILLNWFVAPRTLATARRNTPYECGDPPLGSGWVAYHIRYYIFALLFVVFDVEAIFLFSWVAVFKTLGLWGFIEVAIFIVILVIGLLYAWKKGVLRWI
ncbi:MAG: NADH-quinone oxidoreductase subunit [Clostridia bacterium]|nr:NADH-quinone oxidoreductase subunit [Clostridia bacterium]